jgi:hypothetical protein
MESQNKIIQKHCIAATTSSEAAGTYVLPLMQLSPSDSTSNVKMAKV